MRLGRIKERLVYFRVVLLGEGVAHVREVVEAGELKAVSGRSLKRLPPASRSL